MRASESPRRSPAWLLPLLLAGCSGGYQQGDCEVGYLDVHGVCTLAVGPACEDGGDCLSGLCARDEQERGFCTVRCGEDEDCPAEFYCETWSDRRCYPGQRPPPCTADGDCGACFICLEGHCRQEPGCTTCLVDGDCAACQRCAEGECVEVAGCTTCTTDAGCAACELCLSGRCQHQAGCLLCATDLDCPGCTECDRGGCAAIPGCGTDPCFNDFDCPARTRCVLDSQSGFQVCLPSALPYGADCTRGGAAVCAEGVCLQTASGTSTCSRPCAGPEDCPGDTQCSPDEACLFACRPPYTLPPGDACAADRDCAFGSLCGLVAAADGTSWQARCKAPLPCAGVAGESCTPGDEHRGRCQSGICTELAVCTSVCTSDFDCPVGSGCVELSAPLPGSGLPAPFPGCAAWDAGLGEVGEPCPRGDVDCRAGACLAPPTGGHPFCSPPCAAGQADCPDRFACLADPLAPQVTRCQPALIPASCAADADCAAGEVCGLDPGGVSLSCQPPRPDGAPAGERCASADGCGAGLCSTLGLCAAACRDGGDCPAGLACDVAELRLPGGGRAWAHACTLPAGSLRPCRSDADCAEAAELCALWPNPREAGFQARCRTPWAGGAAPGASCEAPADCATLLCDLGGQCGAVCLADADCPFHFVCALVLVPAPWGEALFATSCVPRNAALGQPCPQGDLDCASGLCHAAGYCTQTCATDADCAAAAGMLCAAEPEPRVCAYP